MANTPTPHIAAAPGDFGKTVLMPGDPKRAAFIAQHYLQDAVLVNDVRGVQGYTGKYRDVRVSVMASGMGMPSIGIYSYELYRFFGVENIIRVGTAGGMQPQVQIRDLVFGMGACTDSAYAKQFGCAGSIAPVCSYDLLAAGVEIAQSRKIPFHVGNLLSTDAFYHANPNANKAWRKMGVLAVEMEAAALYLNAASAGKRALAICTVSDHLLTGDALDAAAREQTFTQMMELALEIAVETEQRS